MILKTRIVQPEYSTDINDADRLFEWEINMLKACDSSLDLIVFPEACDVPAYAKTKEEFEGEYRKYNERFLKEAAETAKRCNARVFVNAVDKTDGLIRNTTFVFGTDGQIKGKYYKEHLTKGEIEERKLDCKYTYENSQPYILISEGIKFAFLTCYDFYFYENFANIARYKPDIIIGCSHQRSDTHDALEIITRFCAYNTNAWVIRSSVSMGKYSENIGGCSMAVKPNGEIAVNMKNRVGYEDFSVDTDDKYYKPAGFDSPIASHADYIEQGRRPMKYRVGGPGVVMPDKIMPYPRICAHRGFNTLIPENSMPAFGAAVAGGAQEIEFDLWETEDKEIVSLHDSSLDRVSDGKGYVWEYTLKELKKFDFGIRKNPAYAGLRIVTFEDILKKFACRVIMNIHIKSRDNSNPLPKDYLQKIIDMIRKYECEKHCYFMTGNDTVMMQLKELAPDIARCVGAGDDAYGTVDRAIRMGCEKVQLFKPEFNAEMIKKAHENNIRCNVFWSDDPKEAKKFSDMGIDCILTNDYFVIAAALES